MSDFGYVCQRCGLSDYGLDRMRSNGFTPRPCPDCVEHFRQRCEEAEQ